ncbi:MAG TPA: hypothetical protein VIL45_07055 [Thermoplasmata archaeon]
MAPSIKTIREAFPSLEEGKAGEIRALLAGKRDPERYESVRKWLSQCYNRPDNDEMILEACNEILGGYGTEAIWDEDSELSPVATYVNVGDPYVATILYDCYRGTWRIMGYGDWVELAERRGIRIR